MPVTTRRNGGSSSGAAMSSSPATTSSASPKSTSATSPLIPTPLETILLALYPATLGLGSLFSLLEPHARAAPYSATSQSHPASQAPSYFAKKSNLFNLFFVKIAWFWVTLTYLLFLFLHPSTGPGRSLVLTPKRLQGLVRWTLVTMWWCVVTQWFFGPALIDRGFRITGGACELANRFDGTGGTREFVTSQACKIAGGQWRGGHDISGHVFILVLGSAFLGLELLPTLAGKRGLREERRVKRRNGVVERIEREGTADDDDDNGGNIEKGGIGAPLTVVGLSWWMLLMTAAYFHTWFEKFTGLLVAFLGVFVVYLLPRALPAMRDIVGMPSV